MIKDDLAKIVSSAREKILSSIDSSVLNDIRVAVLGKKGELTSILKGMKDVPEDERPKIGALVNDARKAIEDALAEKKKALEALELSMKLSRESIDVTLPAKRLKKGHPHPDSLALSEIKRIFTGMGYEVVDGPDIELDYYNFEALNIPEGHPAKDEQDTFYINKEILLRTQTSGV